MMQFCTDFLAFTFSCFLLKFLSQFAIFHIPGFYVYCNPLNFKVAREIVVTSRNR